MLVSGMYAPPLSYQAYMAYSRAQYGSPEERTLPPPMASLPDMPVSEVQNFSADAFLAPRRNNPMKQPAQRQYKCSICSYSSYIGALYEYHIAHAHSHQGYMPMPIPIETGLVAPIAIGQLPPQQQQQQPQLEQQEQALHSGHIVLHSPPVRSNTALCLPTAYYTPVVQVATSPSEASAASPAAESPTTAVFSGSFSEHSAGHSTDSKSDSENDVAKLQVCTFSGCGYASNSKKFFHRHIQYAHRKKRQMSCTRCQFATRDPIVYKNHLLEHLGL